MRKLSPDDMMAKLPCEADKSVPYFGRRRCLAHARYEHEGRKLCHYHAGAVAVDELINLDVKVVKALEGLGNDD